MELLGCPIFEIYSKNGLAVPIRPQIGMFLQYCLDLQMQLQQSRTTVREDMAHARWPPQYHLHQFWFILWSSSRQSALIDPA